MPRKQQAYDDIPGTFVFDAERSREGFGINMFCMSLMKDENRKAFKANEAEYLKKFRLTPEQTEAVLKRDYNRMLELGGNIYFTAKLGATDGHSFQHLAAVMTGTTQEDYAEDDARRRPFGRGQPLAHRRRIRRRSIVGAAAAKKSAAQSRSQGQTGQIRPGTKAKSKPPQTKSIQIPVQISKTEVSRG